MRIREATRFDAAALVEIWHESVKATHHFLSAADIEELLPLVREELAQPQLELWVLEAEDGSPAGFMGLSGAMVEALFIAPRWIRKGGGRRLIEHARQLKGTLQVDVNEQNPEAVKFYLACGFEVVGRSPVDAAGRPFPLLHMRER